MLLFKAVCFLFIRRLSWFDSSGLGFSLEYPSIGLHAISRDVSAYPQEHLYVMVNGKLNSEAKFTSELYIPFYLFRPPKICSFWGAGGVQSSGLLKRVFYLLFTNSFFTVSEGVFGSLPTSPVSLQKRTGQKWQRKQLMMMMTAAVMVVTMMKTKG